MAGLMPLQRSVTPWKVNRKCIISADVTVMSSLSLSSDSSSDSSLQSGGVHVHSGPHWPSAHLPAQRRLDGFVQVSHAGSAHLTPLVVEKEEELVLPDTAVSRLFMVACELVTIKA